MFRFNAPLRHLQRARRLGLPTPAPQCIPWGRWVATTTGGAAHAASALPDTIDDDFVAPAALGRATTAGLTPAAHQGTAIALPPLGIERVPDTPDEMEFTRLGLVATETRGGQPMVRDATRRADETAPTEDEIERLIAVQAEQAQWGDEGRATTAGTVELPYDDPTFADAILKMEVEGALDDLWQDAPRARIEDVEAIVNIMRELKVRDVVAINTSAKTSSFDYLVVGTCDSLRHISLVAWSVSEADRLQRATKVKRQKSDDVWDVVTVGRIVVNLMVEGYRNEVNIERKWAVTKSMDPLDHANSPVSEGRLSRMHGLWSLTLNLQDLEDFEVDYCKDVLLRQL